MNNETWAGLPVWQRLEGEPEQWEFCHRGTPGQMPHMPLPRLRRPWAWVQLQPSGSWRWWLDLRFHSLMGLAPTREGAQERAVHFIKQAMIWSEHHAEPGAQRGARRRRAV